MRQNRIVKILMNRDGMSKEEAEEMFLEAQMNFYEMLDEGESFDPDEFLEDWFSLEPDYLEDLLR